jgi:hypothetical protein
VLAEVARCSTGLRYRSVAGENPNPFDIALIGMGVRHVTHMTLEALQVLQR